MIRVSICLRSKEDIFAFTLRKNKTIQDYSVSLYAEMLKLLLCRGFVFHKRWSYLWEKNNSPKASFDSCQNASSSVCLEIIQPNAVKKDNQGFTTSQGEEEQLCLFSELYITFPVAWAYSEQWGNRQKVVILMGVVEYTACPLDLTWCIPVLECFLEPLWSLSVAAWTAAMEFLLRLGFLNFRKHQSGDNTKL